MGARAQDSFIAGYLSSRTRSAMNLSVEILGGEELSQRRSWQLERLVVQSGGAGEYTASYLRAPGPEARIRLWWAYATYGYKAIAMGLHTYEAFLTDETEVMLWIISVWLSLTNLFFPGAPFGLD